MASKTNKSIRESKAYRQAEAGHYSTAGSMLLNVAEMDPPVAERWLQAAEWLLRDGQAQRALRALRTGVKVNAENTETRQRLLLALAEHHLGLQDWTEGAAACRELLRENPRHHNGLELLATALLQTNQLNEAIEVMQLLLRLSPRDPLHRLKLATLFQLQGRLGESLREFQRVLDQNGGFPFAQDAEEAIDSLDRLQTQQILMMAAERDAFRLKLEREFDIALVENGFHLTDMGHESLRNMVADLTPAEHPAPPRSH